MFDGLRSGTRYWMNRINELNGRCIDLEAQLAVAKAENDRLTAECKAWDDGRDELVQSHQDEIIEYLEQIQNLLDENSHLKEIVEQHNNACLPSL